jgi:hypothetical protein
MTIRNDISITSSPEDWITNLESLNVYDIDNVLDCVSTAPLRNINLENLFEYDVSAPISDLIVKRNPTTGEILDFYEDFKLPISNDDEDDFIGNSNDNLLIEIPTVGRGIDFDNKYSKNDSQHITNATRHQSMFGQPKVTNKNESGSVNIAQAFLRMTSLDESLLDISLDQSLLDESMLSLTHHMDLNDSSITDILALDNEDKKVDLDITPTKDTSTSSSNSDEQSVLSSKKTAKKWAIEADIKLVKSYDEIKSKLAYQVPSKLIFSFFKNFFIF